MAHTVPFQPGMLIGRTYDLQKLRPGLDIFTDEALTKCKTTDTSHTSIEYAVIKESKDVNRILDVGGEISLKCKAGIMKAEGIGKYLTEDRTQDNTLEILARAHVETITITLTTSNPRPGWSENVVGSHYIRSVTYGGDLIVRIRIEGSDDKHLSNITAKVEAGLQLQGIIDAGAKANFLKLEQELKESSNIEISYYSTSLQGMIPRDIVTMLRDLDSFKDQVLKNEGKGVQLICELQPLSVLDSKLVNVLRDKNLNGQLRTLESNYDDVLEAKSRLTRFMKSERGVDLNDDEEHQAKDIEDRIEELEGIFSDVIGNLDVTTAGAGAEQMKPALEAYKEKKKAGGISREVAKFVRSSVHKVDDSPVLDLPSGDPLDLILVGKTGQGKSATANTIFGENLFNSQMRTSSVTDRCQKEFSRVGNRGICVVDTPGTVDTKNPDGTIAEIAKAITIRPDGYHAFLLVISVNTRMTEEDQMAIIMLKRLFGKDILMTYAVLVFTYGDLFYKEQKKGKTFEDFLESQDSELCKLLAESKKRYVLFDNSESDAGKKRQQVIQLIKIIDKLQNELNGQKYTNDLFHDAKRMMEDEKAMAEKQEQERMSAVREAVKKEAIQEMEEKVASQLANKCKEEGRGCFLGDAKVKLENGRTLKMKDLKVGDKVLSAETYGILTFSEVYFFGHRDEYGISEYIKISTASTELKMTPDHHVYLISSHRTYTVPCEQIKIGDHILVFNVKTTTLEEEVVISMSSSTEIGVYSPLTMSGTIIVNDMFVSCYGDYVSPRLSHTLLWPMRQIYCFSPTLSAWLNAPGENGMPGWVKWIMDHIILPNKK